MRYREIVCHARSDAAFIADVLGKVLIDGKLLDVVEATVMHEVVAEPTGEAPAFKPGRLGLRLVGTFAPGIHLADMATLDAILATAAVRGKGRR